MSNTLLITPCPFCTTVLFSHELRDHVKAFHPNQMCVQCNNPFVDMTLHQHMHHPVASLAVPAVPTGPVALPTCLNCSSTFMSYHELLSHMRNACIATRKNPPKRKRQPDSVEGGEIDPF
jgi:hypothetical protein